eukprot:1700785-Prymnesium_polylepis.1
MCHVEVTRLDDSTFLIGPHGRLRQRTGTITGEDTGETGPITGFRPVTPLDPPGPPRTPWDPWVLEADDERTGGR